MFENKFPISMCVVCGSKELAYSPILWPELIDAWNLAEYEVDYINLQQGLYCTRCKVNLRTMALAKAMMQTKHYDGLFSDFVQWWKTWRIKVLEINRVGQLTPFLRKLRHHQLTVYPDTDIMNMSYQDGYFDFVLHSDTLEHINDPVKGLSECHRILKKSGYCIFTVPIVVDRLSRTRDGLYQSYHGNKQHESSDMMVVSEYGADVWKQPIMAGFSECRIYSLVYPSAQAILGVK